MLNKNFQSSRRIIFFIFLLNIIYVLSLFYRYYGVFQHFEVGGPDVSMFAEHFLRIKLGSLPYKDYFSFYGPFLFYLSYPLYYLLGANFASLQLLYFVIWPFLGYLLVSIFAFHLYENKKYACLLLLIILIYDSTTTGGNAFSFRASFILLGLLFLLKLPKNERLAPFFGIFLAFTYLFDIIASITLSIITVLYFLLSLFIESKKHIILQAVKTFVGFAVPFLLWIFFLVYNGVLIDTFIFIRGAIEQVPVYLLETPFDQGKISVIEFLKTIFFYELKYFYLIIIFGYSVCIFYLFSYFFKKREINKRFIISILILSSGIIISRRLFVAYWYDQTYPIILLFTFLLYNLEQWLEKFGKKKIRFGKKKVRAEIAIIGFFLIFSLVTSKYVRDLIKGEPKKPLQINEVYVKKAGMNLRKEQAENLYAVLNFLKDNLNSNEKFYTYPWGLYNYFAGIDIPVKFNAFYIGALKDSQKYQEAIINDLNNKKIRFIIANRDSTLGVVGIGKRGDVDDYLSWGNPSSPAMMDSKMALFILENYETVKVFPLAIILQRRDKPKSYPYQMKRIRTITSNELKISGAEAENKAGMPFLKDIGSKVSFRFQPKSALPQYSSALEIEARLVYNPFRKLLNQEFFVINLRIYDDKGQEYNVRKWVHSSNFKNGYLKIPYISNPIKVSRFDLVFEFTPSKFNNPPSKIYFNRIHLALHRDKGYSF